MRFMKWKMMSSPWADAKYSVGLLLVILFNGFPKKTQKTPVGEIDKAERLMKEYFNNK